MKNNYSTITKISTALAVIALSGSLIAQLNPLKKSPKDLEDRITENRLRFEERQAHPSKAIPNEILADAKGIIILHNIKAGLGIGGEIGNGLALVKNKETGLWSAPAFVSMAEGTFGFQIGAEGSVTIMVLMTDESLRILRQGVSGNAGVELKSALGPIDAGGKLDTTTLRKPVLVYTDAGGAYAGANLKAGGIVGARKKNETLYGMKLNDILFEAEPRLTKAGGELIESVIKFSTPKKDSE